MKLKLEWRTYLQKAVAVRIFMNSFVILNVAAANVGCCVVDLCIISA